MLLFFGIQGPSELGAFGICRVHGQETKGAWMRRLSGKGFLTTLSFSHTSTPARSGLESLSSASLLSTYLALAFGLHVAGLRALCLGAANLGGGDMRACDADPCDTTTGWASDGFNTVVLTRDIATYPAALQKGLSNQMVTCSKVWPCTFWMVEA